MFYRAGYIRLSVNWDFLREGFIFGFKSHLGDIAQYLVYRLDLPLVGYFAGLSAAGYYSIATRLAELIWLPSNTLRAMLLARVSNRKTQDSEEITPYVTRNVLAFGIVFAFALAFSSWLFIQWVLPEYLPSVPLLWVILPGAITASAFRVLIGDIAGRGSPGLVAKIALGGLLGGLALYFILIPRFEAMGASLASSILYTCECSAAMWAVSKLMGDRITEFIVIKKHDLYVLRGLLRSARKMRFDNEHVLR
jgi:O-antigen/teichoic acid export membrane protein